MATLIVLISATGSYSQNIPKSPCNDLFFDPDITTPEQFMKDYPKNDNSVCDIDPNKKIEKGYIQAMDMVGNSTINVASFNVFGGFDEKGKNFNLRLTFDPKQYDRLKELIKGKEYFTILIGKSKEDKLDEIRIPISSLIPETYNKGGKPPYAEFVVYSTEVMKFPKIKNRFYIEFPDYPGEIWEGVSTKSKRKPMPQAIE